jgi:hypothetical protein
LPGSFKNILRCIGLSLSLGLASVNAQILHDTTALGLVRKDVDYIYNLQFNSAREVYEKIIRLYPEHPIVFLLRGIMTYWENYPMLHTSISRASFEEDMLQCIKLSEANKNPAYEAEYLLANLCARGMLLMFYDDNGLIMEVIPLTTSSYKHLKRAFDLNSVCSDLYYFTGAYNYYREAYPRIYPVYKPFLLLFRSGNTELGIEELHKACINSVVLRGESYSLLSLIYLNFENNYPQSLYYYRILHEQYPENEYYINLYIKDLLFMKQYNEAEKMIYASQESGRNNYFQAQHMILKGILQEKKYHDNKLAQQYYKTGITVISSFGEYGSEFAAYAYFGLSRISEANGEAQSKKIYRKEAMKLADFEKINFDN